MDYIELSIKITPFKEEFAEIVEASLCELPFESFVIEEPYLKAYIRKEEFSVHNLKTIFSAYLNKEEFKIDYQSSLILEQNWNKEWESSFEPIIIDNKLTIKAPFHKNLHKTAYNIKIEPKMAFGTGHHQTTTLMVRMLFLLNGERGDYDFIPSKKSIKGLSVLDMGTGTGVLAFLAAKMGALRPVHAIDIDLTAVHSALENAWKNRLNKAVEILCADASLIQKDKYNLILANINRNILLEDMPTYLRGLKVNGYVVISGFYKEDIELLRNNIEKLGARVVWTEVLDDWASMIIKK